MKEIFKTKTKVELSKEEFPGLTLEELKEIIVNRQKLRAEEKQGK